MFATKYDKIRVLGSGGYARVFLVQPVSSSPHIHHPRLACKVSTFIERLRTEHKIMQHLSGCPGVMQVHDFMEDAGSAYMVMDLAEGPSLTSWLDQHNRLVSHMVAEKEAKAIVRNALHALTEVHSRGVVHNDIKPGNIMLGRQDGNTSWCETKLIDFGNAFFTCDGPLSCTEGTPWFMSPESLSTKAECRSDVWSLGVTAYLMLIGSLPFDDYHNRSQPMVSRIWNSIITEQIDDRESLRYVSPAARQFLLDLLQKDVARRPQAADALGHKWLSV